MAATTRTTVPVLVLAMLTSGAANSLLTKYQDMQCVKHCEVPGDPRRENFEQPVWQSLNMFIGEFSCLLVYHLQPHLSLLFSRSPSSATYSSLPQSAADNSRDSLDADADSISDSDSTSDLPLKPTLKPLTGTSKLLFIIPTICDLTGTTLMNIGLIYTPVSIYQMTRGLLVLWVGVLSVLFLKRKLWAYQWGCLVLVTSGVALVGLAGSLVKKAVQEGGGEGDVGEMMRLVGRIVVERVKRAVGEEDAGKVLVGVLFIAGAQVFTASQFVVEEKILSVYTVEPLEAVGLEGIYGVLLILLALPILHLLFSSKSDYFNAPLGFHQLTGDGKILGTSAAICVSIAIFNLSGLSVTRAVSAAARSTIDTCRTLVIWVVSLSLGWEVLVWPFSGLQALGFCLLVYGTVVFNGLVKPPIFKPPAISLPHEPQLEQTGELPAAGAEGRTGYDVLPTEESGRRR